MATPLAVKQVFDVRDQPLHCSGAHVCACPAVMPAQGLGLGRLHFWEFADGFNVDLSRYIDEECIFNSNNLGKIRRRYSDFNFVINFIWL